MEEELHEIARKLVQAQLMRYGRSGKTHTEFFQDEDEVLLSESCARLHQLAAQQNRSPFQ